MESFNLPNNYRSALELLYGHCNEPILICSKNMDLLWQNAQDAQQLYLPLLTQLQSDADAKLLLPSNHIVPVSVNDTMYHCHISEIGSSNNENLLLCRFFQQESLRYPSNTEYRAILSADSAELRTIAAELVTTSEQIRRSEPACEAVTASAVQQLSRICYRLLNQSARCREMLWYDSLTESQLSLLPITDLRPTLERTLSQIQNLTADFMTFEPMDAFEPIPAQIDPDRFETAILLLFTELQKGDSSHTAFFCETVREKAHLCLTIRISELGETHCSRLHPSIGQEDAAAATSAACLIARFCETFLIELLHTSDASSRTATMRIPLATSGVVPLQFAAGAPLREDRFSRARQFLSVILDFPSF